MDHLDTKDNFSNVSSAKSIGDAFWQRALSNPDAPVFRWASAPSVEATRSWRTETYNSVKAPIARLAHYLQSLGVGVGTPVAIISQTRPEWIISDLAIQTLGGVTVSIYQSLPAHEAGYILFDSKAEIIFVENEEQAKKITNLTHSPCPIPEHEGFSACEVQLKLRHIISFESIADHEIVTYRSIVEAAALPSDPPQVPRELSRECVASYVYTSGTTGPPKGVIQTHGNHLTNVAQVSEAGVFILDGSLFLYLPLAHSFARLACYVGALTSAYLVLPAICDHKTSKIDLTSVARDLRDASADVIPSVPRLFEKMASAIQARAIGSSIKHKILGVCLKNAMATYQRRSNNQPISTGESLLYAALAPIRNKIKRELFGATFKHGISGGARLDPNVNRFFDALGIVICEGYGLTETCVATHVNLPLERKIGSVGRALAGVEARTANEDGEIIMRGPNITRGYLNRPKATAEAWDNQGWFHSGDVGRIDEDGFLFITDRKKEIVVTAGGKKIAPQAIEGLFKRYPFISQALYYGDGKPNCVMLFTINPSELRVVLKDRGVAVKTDTELSSHPATLQLFDQAVREANQTLASYETVKRFKILPEDFTIENGLLTPTMKMKRKTIITRYLEAIESMYL